MRASNKDLTVGEPSKVLWKFCLPLLGSILFQQMYNIADSLVAGKFIGENALAAVGNSYEITLIFLAFATGCNIGCSVLVSQLFGSRDLKALKTGTYTAMITSGAVCLVLLALGLVTSGSMLKLINTPEDIFGDSKLYLDIYVLGLPFLFFYNISTGIFSALGDSKTPFIFLSISSTANIAVDILFVTVFRMGVAGVAWATFLCQGVSCVLAVGFVLRRMAQFRTEERPALFSRHLAKRFAGIAVPSILQQSSISLGNIIIQGVINGFGPGVIAGYAAAIKLNNLVITSFTTLGNGISNYSAQNLGAGKTDRIRQGFGAGMKMIWTFCVPVVIVYLFASEALIRCFMETPSQDALSTGITFLRIVAPFYFVVSGKLVADGILRGTGRMKAFMVSTFSDLILRVTLSWIFAQALGSVGIWMSWPVGWTVGAVLSIGFYRRHFISAKAEKRVDSAI